MRCPICQKAVTMADPCMPFCSDRCQLLDLGNWASEKYVISTPASPEDDEIEDLPGEEE
jgi:uncharacterized protein